MINQIRQFIATGKEIKYTSRPLNREALKLEIKMAEEGARKEIANTCTLSIPSIATPNIQGANNTTTIPEVVDNGMISKMIQTMNNLPPINLETV